MRNNAPLLAFLAIVVITVVKSAAFVVPEGRQVVITQFGRPIGEAITNAGLHFKIPFVQEARIIERRILNWDGTPNEFPTKDKKLIKVDTTGSLDDQQPSTSDGKGS